MNRGTKRGIPPLGCRLPQPVSWLFTAVGSGDPSVARGSGGSQAGGACRDNWRWRVGASCYGVLVACSWVSVRSVLGLVVAVLLVVSVVAHPGTSAALPSGVVAGSGESAGGGGFGVPAADVFSGGGSRFAQGTENPPAADTFTAVASGWGHSCRIRTGGDVVCWGDNGSGQADAPSGLFTAIAAGWSHSCGIRTGGDVVCWGATGGGEAASGAFTADAVNRTGFPGECFT